jgi:HD-GYP domain-containing protein (c-di-GMP phosphodiesterase class II)
MRFRTRVFLLCFVPFALLMSGSFWAIQRLVQGTVREGLLSSLRANHQAVARLRARTELQNSRFLKVVGENASLKAGLQLLRLEPSSAEARQTVEDQLHELCEQMGFDFLQVSDPGGAPLAAVMRKDGQVSPVSGHASPRGLMMLDDHVYQIASVPIDQAEENLGSLSVGEYFDFSEFSTPVVLLSRGQVLKSSLPGLSAPETEAALRACGNQDDCDVRLRGQTYISLPLPSASFGEGYTLRSLQNVDASTGPVQSVLNHVFLFAFIGVAMVALLFSFMSARSIVEPIATIIARLRRSESTGLLPEFERNLSPVREIQELTSGFNRAAGAIREAREHLQRAYVEFVGSLASALDARDRYTSGHSGRVSEVSCSIARAMNVEGEQLDEIRIGALLHDIGKIGISDTVLLKPGRLTPDETALVRQHPSIGKKILEGVQGFAPYLNAVELHHENWDGTGYPHGQRGEETPLAARIIHVSDAYDAMTTDRPYRRGMTPEAALAILQKYAGTQFDPYVVEAFLAGLAAERDREARVA